jgi:single-strand DNA-binding protein
MNSVIITGRLYKKPEIKFRKEGKSKICIAKFILVSRKPNSNKPEAVNYIYCEARGNNAEFARKYFEVGKSIGIEGYLDIKSFINDNGKRQNIWKIIVEKQEFLERKNIEKEIIKNIREKDNGEF